MTDGGGGGLFKCFTDVLTSLPSLLKIKVKFDYTKMKSNDNTIQDINVKYIFRIYCTTSNWKPMWYTTIY